MRHRNMTLEIYKEVNCLRIQSNCARLTFSQHLRLRYSIFGPDNNFFYAAPMTLMMDKGRPFHFAGAVEERSPTQTGSLKFPVRRGLSS